MPNYPLCAVLATRTNILETPPARKPAFPPTEEKTTKRRYPNETSKPQKRLKLDPSTSSADTEDSDSDYEIDDDVDMGDVRTARNARKLSPFQVRSTFLAKSSANYRTITPSTLPILHSFVSSYKTDVFKCQSVGTDTYLTPPYSCSFSHNAKNGGIPLLAVATEQGTVHILNTSKRANWDVEPPRMSIQPHDNGVFDLKWNNDDTALVTCSGDQSARISSVSTGVITHVLQGHSGTVKCAAWDPTHQNLLATGGRDGAICLWDSRLGTNDQVAGLSPVIKIHGAHEETTNKSKPRPQKGKNVPTPRSITNLLYPDCEPYGLVSSCSFDGLLRYWDLRAPTNPRKGRAPKAKVPTSVFSSSAPTSPLGPRRSRGITSLAAGSGPTRGLLFGLGADSHVRSYTLPDLIPQSTIYTHEKMQTNSFYVGISMSPCGRWLACGGTGTTGSSYLFDVENACRPGFAPLQGVELGGRSGEVGAVDWGKDMLASCSDDGTVRVWRPDLETRLKCVAQPDEYQWEWNWSS